jgi:sulfide:quinone oxidoreductase
LSVRVIVVGAGPGGLAAAERLAGRGGAGVEVMLVSPRGRAVLHAGVLDVALGRSGVERFSAAVTLPGVELRAATVDDVGPDGVVVEGARLQADAVIAAPGLELGEVPAWSRAVSAWDPDGAARARAALPEISSGRLVVAACGLPYRCPPAPFALAVGLAEQHHTARHTVSVSAVTPEPVPLAGVGGEAPVLVLEACASAGVTVERSFEVDLGASEDGVLRARDGRSVRYDAAFLVPPHRRAGCLRGLPGAGPLVQVGERGSVDGSLLYVVGDAAATGMPRAAGVARALGLAAADDVLARLGIAPAPEAEAVRAACFMFHYGGALSRLRVSYPGPAAGPAGSSDPVVEIDGPSLDLAAAREGERRRFLAAASGGGSAEASRAG